MHFMEQNDDYVPINPWISLVLSTSVPLTNLSDIALAMPYLDHNSTSSIENNTKLGPHTSYLYFSS